MTDERKDGISAFGGGTGFGVQYDPEHAKGISKRIAMHRAARQMTDPELVAYAAAQRENKEWLARLTQWLTSSADQERRRG